MCDVVMVAVVILMMTILMMILMMMTMTQPQDQVFVLGADKAREFVGVLAQASMLPLGQHWPGVQR